MDALVTGIAVLAVIAMCLRWASKDEQSRTVSDQRSASTASACRGGPRRSASASAHGRAKGPGCNQAPRNIKRL